MELADLIKPVEWAALDQAHPQTSVARKNNYVHCLRHISTWEWAKIGGLTPPFWRLKPTNGHQGLRLW